MRTRENTIKTLKTRMPKKLHGQTVQHLNDLSAGALKALKANPDLLALLDYEVRRADWQPVYESAAAVHAPTALAAAAEGASEGLSEQDRLDVEAALGYVVGIEEGKGKAIPNANALQLTRKLLETALGMGSEEVLRSMANRRSPRLVALEAKTRDPDPWSAPGYQRPDSGKLTALQVQTTANQSGPWATYDQPASSKQLHDEAVARHND